MGDEAVAAPHVMVVEDDASLARWIADYLADHGFLVSVATRGDEALALIESDAPDLVVLDLNLPVLDGLEICRRARAFFRGPVLMLTARDAEDDEIRGLDSGADDYLRKPVAPRVLLARVQALLRRESPARVPNALVAGALTLDIDSRTVALAGEVVAVSTLEFDVLACLVESAGQVVSRDALVRRIRGIEYDGFDRSVDVCVSRLRRRFGDDAGEPRRIKTVRGKGYLLAPDAW